MNKTSSRGYYIYKVTFMHQM